MWWVELATVDHGERVAEAIAMALGLPEAASLSALTQLETARNYKHALVVIDNCEHLIDSCDTSSTICCMPAGRSRSSPPAANHSGPGRNRFCGCHLFRYPPTTRPVRRSRRRTRALVCLSNVRNRPEPGSSASRQRRSGGRDSVVDSTASRSRRTGGGAHPRSLLSTRVVSELTERFRVLTGGARTVLPRHQTLLASVDWSHDLLTSDERILLRRLAVFVGDFTADAAEQVAAGDDLDSYLLELVGRLVDKKLGPTR